MAARERDVAMTLSKKRACTTGHADDEVEDGDIVYEDDGVVFNLSAATRCLEATRREVGRGRAGAGVE